MQVTVREKAPGRALSGSCDVLVELTEEPTTVGELIRRAVEEQLRLAAVDVARCGDVRARRYLLDDEILTRKTDSMIRLRPRVPALPPVADAVTRAHRAFERNAFAVFVGWHQAERLDDEIVLRPGEPVLFLRTLQRGQQ